MQGKKKKEKKKDLLYAILRPEERHALITHVHSRPNSKHWFTTSFLSRKVPESDARSVTPGLVFRHLPPNSAMTGYSH